MERNPGVNVLDAMKLTDRQIYAAYFPDPASRQQPRTTLTAWQVFEQVGKSRNMTDAAIRAAWNAQAEAANKRKAKPSHVRGNKQPRQRAKPRGK